MHLPPHSLHLHKHTRMDAKLILDFLTTLKLNNNREWFQDNNKTYEKARGEAEKFYSELITEISAIDSTIAHVQVKDCMFRIFRDVRFSHDKSPYKTNFGAFITPGGRKSSLPGYYFHFEPGESFLAAGVYQPEPDVLKLLRDEMYFRSADFRSILNDKPFGKYFASLDVFDKMKKPPKDYPADFKDIDLLKYRSYIVLHTFSDSDLAAEDLMKQILQMVRVLQPFMNFLSGAIRNR